MLSIGIDYLNGFVMATHPTDRNRPEWPPHPDRVFMALAAAYFETEGGDDERDALEWLESQGPPQISFSPRFRPRTTVTTYVPVNDTGSPIKKNKALMSAGSLPLGRDRQPRVFPLAVLADPQAYLHWLKAEPTGAQQAALEKLCQKVTHVGHSISLVQMWVDKSHGQSPAGAIGKHVTLVPSEASASRLRLRVPGMGRLRRLESACNKAVVEEYAQLKQAIDAARGKAKQVLKEQLVEKYGTVAPQSLRPSLSLWQGYSLASSTPSDLPAHGSCFSPTLLVLRSSDQQLSRRRFGFGLESTLQIVHALRNCVMKACPGDPPPEWLGGHQADGRPSQRSGGHLALLPLAHVGNHRHADGRLLGVGLAIPRDVPRSEIAECLHPLLFDDQGWLKPIRLLLGRLGEWSLELDDIGDSRQSLNPETWTSARSPARRWATVTPIALDRHVKSKYPWDEISQIIAEGCERIGLPRPVDVIPTGVSMFLGAPPSREMPRIERKSDGGRIRQAHAVLAFAEPIIGPVLIGAGRYKGYGLCRPMREDLR